MTCAATPLAVRDTLMAVNARLANWQAPCDPRVEIVLAEALNNIVEHAYGADGSGEICLGLKASETMLTILLRDKGAPMPGGGLPDGAFPDPNDLPEGGWGWALIQTCCDSVSYQRCNGQNKLTLIFRQVES